MGLTMLAFKRAGQFAILAVLLAVLGIAVLASPARADLIKDCDGDDDEVAIKACTQLIQQNPRNATAYYNRGVSYQNLDREAEALESYNEAIKINPKNSDYFHNRASAHDRLGNLDRTIEDFNTALKLSPSDASSIGPRAWARARANKELKEALADLDVLVKKDPKAGAPFVTRSLVYYRLKQWKEAIADADSAIKLYEKNEDALYIRGMAKIAAGDEKGGNEDLAAARAIDANVPDYFAKYGIK